MKIALLTESYPPIIDGVATTVEHYAAYVNAHGGTATVVLPKLPVQADDTLTMLSAQPTLEYPSLGTVADGEYPLGMPFLWGNLKACCALNPDIIHAHSPFMSMSLARRMQKKIHKPIILTYHTKYMYELERHARTKFMKNRAALMMKRNVDAADEIWVSSLSAAQDLQSLGYSGGHIRMIKGTDFTTADSDTGMVSELRTRYNVTYNVPTFLFVGRLVWHKNIKLILDAMVKLKERGKAFKMLFVGEGPDRVAMEDYIATHKLDGLVHFLGLVRDRAQLKAFYHMADLLVFPSVFDNGAQVIIEAAACSLPTVVARTGAAAETMEDGVNGFLCDTTVESLADAVEAAVSDMRQLRRVGASAKNTLYKNWDSVGEAACRRYEIVSKIYSSKLAEISYVRLNNKRLNTPPTKIK